MVFNKTSELMTPNMLHDVTISAPVKNIFVYKTSFKTLFGHKPLSYFGTIFFYFPGMCPFSTGAGGQPTLQG